MKKIVVLHLGQGEDILNVSFHGETFNIHRIGCNGNADSVRQRIQEFDGQVNAIGLDGYYAQLQLGGHTESHTQGSELSAAAKRTPVVDGSGLRATLERWGVTLADRLQPGIFSQKRILMTPGLNHDGMAQALRKRGSDIRYADPVVYFALPDFPGVGRPETLDRASVLTLEQLKEAPFRRITPQTGSAGKARETKPFRWADVLAGDIGAIRRYAPSDLKHKIIVVNSATEDDLADLQQRGAAIAVTLLRPFEAGQPLDGVSMAEIEAVFVALQPETLGGSSEDNYLDIIANLDWKPDIRYLQPDAVGVNRFAFVIHPLSVRFIHKHPLFRWTRFLPNVLVENVAAYLPPMYVSRITGGQSPTTGQRIEGHLLSLGATPRMMMTKNSRFTYERLNQASKMAERRGARIMGLGAFTSVVGDAGITIAHEADIAITSGNSLTVAATLEAAKQAVIKMGASDLTRGKAMVIGATGSIGAVCSRLLAQAIHNVVLVSIEPEKLIELKRTIQQETPGAEVTIATKAADHLESCDLVVTATSAFGQRVIDITRCKPGAVICDVARPPDINAAEAALRPDVLVIESGEVLIPGDIDFGYDIGLPPKTSYACLAETALLAMEGRFEDYTLGRNITMERVKEIYRLFKKHQFQLAGLRAFGKYITDEDVAVKRALAEKLRRDAAYFETIKRETGQKLALIPASAKGVSAAEANWQQWGLVVVGAVGVVGLLSWLTRKSTRRAK